MDKEKEERQNKVNHHKDAVEHIKRIIEQSIGKLCSFDYKLLAFKLKISIPIFFG